MNLSNNTNQVINKKLDYLIELLEAHLDDEQEDEKTK